MYGNVFVISVQKLFLRSFEVTCIIFSAAVSAIFSRCSFIVLSETLSEVEHLSTVCEFSSRQFLLKNFDRFLLACFCCCKSISSGLLIPKTSNFR